MCLLVGAAKSDLVVCFLDVYIAVSTASYLHQRTFVAFIHSHRKSSLTLANDSEHSSLVSLALGGASSKAAGK